MEVVAELVAKLPEMEIDGSMSEKFESKVWEKCMSDLTPAEQLAVEIDCFTYDYDTALYHDNSQSMTENVSELAEALKQRDTHDIALWLADVYTEGKEPEDNASKLKFRNSAKCCWDRKLLFMLFSVLSKVKDLLRISMI